MTRSATAVVVDALPTAAYSPYRQIGSSGRSARTDDASGTAIRMAVCIGTEKATPSAHSTRLVSHGSTDTSRARTS